MSGDENTGTTTYRPDWLRKPTADQMARYYPDKAQRLEIGGSAIIRCKVGEAGRLTDCEVLKEAPEGIGFGKAALLLSREFEMTPPPPELVGVKDVTIPITFAAPPPSPRLEPPVALTQAGARIARVFEDGARLARSEAGMAMILGIVILIGGLFGLIRALKADRRVDL
ncbi:MAG: TonB family protein [Caulobacter sp.]